MRWKLNYMLKRCLTFSALFGIYSCVPDSVPNYSSSSSPTPSLSVQPFSSSTPYQSFSSPPSYSAPPTIPSSQYSPQPYTPPIVYPPVASYPPSTPSYSYTPQPSISPQIDNTFLDLNSPTDFNFLGGRAMQFFLPQGYENYFVLIKVKQGNINNITLPKFNTFSIKNIENNYPQLGIKVIQLNNKNSFTISSYENTSISIEASVSNNFTISTLSGQIASCNYSNFENGSIDLKYDYDLPKDFDYNSNNNISYKVNDIPSFEYKYTNTTSNGVIRIDSIDFISSEKAKNDNPNSGYDLDTRLNTFKLDGYTINSPDISSLKYYERYICPGSFTLINLPFKIPSGVGKIHRENWQIKASIIYSDGLVRTANISNNGMIWKIIYVSDGTPNLNTNTGSITIGSLGISLLGNNYKSYTQDYLQYYSVENGYHPGIDYEANFGTPVYSPISGEVVSGTNDSSFINIGRITIKTANNKYFSFLHLNSSSLTTGSFVNIGDLVGASGNTGSTKPHLHVELTTSNRVNYYFSSLNDVGNTLNPILYNQS